MLQARPSILRRATRTERGYMTVIHVQCIGDKALLPQNEFERLVELAQQHEEVTVQMQEDDVPTIAIIRLAEQGGAFDFWREDAEDVYSAKDGEPV